jgi:hypothetical protein
MCRKYDREKFLCGCDFPANDDQGWTYCLLNTRHSPYQAHLCRHRTERHGFTKEMGYMCSDHWTSFIEAKFLAFKNEWLPKLAEVDWEVIKLRARKCVLSAPLEKRNGRWCCGRGEEHPDQMFKCWLGEKKLTLARDKKRRRAIERGEPFEVLWTREEALFAPV